MTKPQVIFFGNGPLANYTLEVLHAQTDVIFHARNADDLVQAINLKKAHPEAFGVLASFGVMIKRPVLEAFAPEGILNLHPSKLPAYRGASPIESAILAGDTDFSYSIMRLVKAMDAGPIYHQDTLTQLPIDKDAIYHALATHGAEWLVDHFADIRTMTPTPQNESEVTFTAKFDKSMSMLQPEKYNADQIWRQIVAYQNFPKPKYEFYGKTCIILKAHVVNTTDMVCDAVSSINQESPIMIKCADRNFVAIDYLQPEGKKPMDARSFLNGYAK